MKIIDLSTYKKNDILYFKYREYVKKAIVKRVNTKTLTMEVEDNYTLGTSDSFTFGSKLTKEGIIKGFNFYYTLHLITKKEYNYTKELIDSKRFLKMFFNKNDGIQKLDIDKLKAIIKIIKGVI